MTASASKSLQPFGGFGKPGEEFARGKGLAKCQTETAGAVESTVPPVGVSQSRSRGPRCCSGVAELLSLGR